MRNVRDIDWDDYTESLPAFLTLVLIPFTFNITDGIAFGFIAYALLKLVTGRGREAHWLIYLFAALFILRYAVPGLH
jgi:AGZA family xanthine/uracil permease-like MFS transporter